MAGYDYDVDKKGWCLYHGQEHELRIKDCWPTLRRFIFDCERAGKMDPQKNMAAYIAAAKKAPRRER